MPDFSACSDPERIHTRYSVYRSECRVLLGAAALSGRRRTTLLHRVTNGFALVALGFVTVWLQITFVPDQVGKHGNDVVRRTAHLALIGPARRTREVRAVAHKPLSTSA
jgi:hypothetical protein